MHMILPALCSGRRLERKPHRLIIANVFLLALLLVITNSKELFIGLGGIAAIIAGLLALGYALQKWQSTHLEWLRSQQLLRSLIAILFLKILFLSTFWVLVLKPQAVPADAQSTSNRLFPQTVKQD